MAWFSLVQRPSPCFPLLIVICEHALAAIIVGALLLGWAVNTLRGYQIQSVLDLPTEALILILPYVIHAVCVGFTGLCALMVGLEVGGCVGGKGGGDAEKPPVSGDTPADADGKP